MNYFLTTTNKFALAKHPWPGLPLDASTLSCTTLYSSPAGKTVCVLRAGERTIAVNFSEPWTPKHKNRYLIQIKKRFLMTCRSSYLCFG